MTDDDLIKRARQWNNAMTDELADRVESLQAENDCLTDEVAYLKKRLKGEGK